MTDQPQPRKHLAKRRWGKNGLTIRCTCGQWQSTSGTRREQDNAHRNHRQVMGEVPRTRKPSRVEQMEDAIRRLTAELEAETAQKLRIAQQAVAEETRLRTELQQAQQQTEIALCRLYHVADRVGQISPADDALRIAIDLITWLDGPLHSDDLSAYRAALDPAAVSGA